MTDQQRLSRWAWTLWSMHQEAHFQLLSQHKHALNVLNPQMLLIRFPCICFILTVIKLLLTYQLIPSRQLIEVPWSPPADLGPLACCSAVDTNPHPRGPPGCPGSRPRRCQRGSWALALPSDEGIAPSGCTHLLLSISVENLRDLSHQVLVGWCCSKCRGGYPGWFLHGAFAFGFEARFGSLSVLKHQPFE